MLKALDVIKKFCDVNVVPRFFLFVFFSPQIFYLCFVGFSGYPKG